MYLHHMKHTPPLDRRRLARHLACPHPPTTTSPIAHRLEPLWPRLKGHKLHASSPLPSRSQHRHEWRQKVSPPAGCAGREDQPPHRIRPVPRQQAGGEEQDRILPRGHRTR
jgi:hypothetical protein